METGGRWWGNHWKLVFVFASPNLRGSIFRGYVSFREGKDNKKWFPGDLHLFFGGGEGKGGVFSDVLASFSVLDIFFRLELSWKRGVKSTSILDRNCEWLMLFLVGPLLTFKVEGRVFQWCKEGNDLDLLFQSLQSESVTSLQQSYNLLPTLRYTKIGIKDGLFWWCMCVHCKWEISISYVSLLEIKIL